MKKLNLSRQALTDLVPDELRAVGGAAGTKETCLCHYPTFDGSCFCSGPCDWSDLC